jgi:hypothetical protein
MAAAAYSVPCAVLISIAAGCCCRGARLALLTSYNRQLGDLVQGSLPGIKRCAG